ncbi:tetratricopeptide repeat protein [Carboxylicivirga taeanensis]|uniref:tetratricopeptide repeat protein n=1 Tax=Carboxylicivirga taeanensis TaxID=1416875 RepID=UPI003F6DD2FA
MDYNKKILQFFTNELDPLQHEELKAAMANNEELKEDMKLQQEILYTLAHHEQDNDDFRKQLKAIGDEFIAGDQEHKRSFRLNYWLAAASVIVVIGLGSYLGLLSGSKYSGSQAFIEYYAPYGTDMTVRGNDQPGSFNAAFEQYHAGDIDAAIVSFTELKSENEELAGFFTGLCYLELGNIADAKQQLEATSKISIFYDEQVKWYLALCYLKLEEYQQAELILTEIKNVGSKYSDDARSLLKKVDF